MTEQNRVTPLGDIEAIALRGAWMGNRGILHRGHDLVRTYASNLWITCELSFRDWRAAQWSEGHYTVLFFHDEAVSLAAGHRPCALCRRPSYDAFRRAWAAGNDAEVPSAAEINVQLHTERLVAYTRDRRFHDLPWAGLPDGVFVRLRTGPALVLGKRLAHWGADGYHAWSDRPRAGTASVITPPSTVGAVAAGYAPQIDPSAAADPDSAGPPRLR